MNDLRDRIAQAIIDRVLSEATRPPEPGARILVERNAAANADAIMPIVGDLAADLDHAERENRRLRGDLERTIREAARLVDDDSRALGMMDAADMIRTARRNGL